MTARGEARRDRPDLGHCEDGPHDDRNGPERCPCAWCITEREEDQRVFFIHAHLDRVEG